MIINDIRIDTASMLTVAPSGIAILLTLVRNAEFFLDTALADWDRRGTGTCSECIQAAGMIALKNLTGLVFPMSFTAPP